MKMDHKRNWITLVSTVLLVLYPCAVYFGLKYSSLKFVGLGMAAIFLTRLIIIKKSSQSVMRPMSFIILLALLLSLVSTVINNELLLRLYPVLMSFGVGVLFFQSLFAEQSMVERFARIKQPDLSLRGIRYTRVVTQVWIVFLALNGLASLYTALNSTREIWSLYNGLISYILMGCLFSVEFLFRLRIMKLEEAVK